MQRFFVFAPSSLETVISVAAPRPARLRDDVLTRERIESPFLGRSTGPCRYVEGLNGTLLQLAPGLRLLPPGGNKGIQERRRSSLLPSNPWRLSELASWKRKRTKKLVLSFKESPLSQYRPEKSS